MENVYGNSSKCAVQNLLCYWPSSKYFACIKSLSPYRALKFCHYLHLTDEDIWHREVNELAQGNTAWKWWYQDWKLGMSIPWTVLLTTPLLDQIAEKLSFKGSVLSSVLMSNVENIQDMGHTWGQN